LCVDRYRDLANFARSKRHNEPHLEAITKNAAARERRGDKQAMKRQTYTVLAIRIGAIGALATLGVALGAAPSAAASLVVQTEGGTVEGKVAVGVENFLNIPYAAPPVGELRWSPPQPPAHWSDVRPAKDYGSYCPQLKTLDSATLAVNEDCLDVNIQRPIGTREDAKLPVYVYIHGGGYVTGSGNKDGQDRIVRTNPVVGVTLNYRLGALGFLALPSLTGGGDFGFEDQQAALGWIKRNIAAFGGDPNAITIGGESAGGWSVCAHLVAPGSRGLFNKAIIQSGACDSKPAAQAEAEGVDFAHKLGCADTTSMVSCLREKPVADVLNAQAPYYLLTDGTPALPTHLWTAVNGGDTARVPILIGSTRDELRSFLQSSVGWTEAQYHDFVRKNFGSRADTVLKLYPWPAWVRRLRSQSASPALAIVVALRGRGDPQLPRAIVAALRRETYARARQLAPLLLKVGVKQSVAVEQHRCQFATEALRVLAVARKVSRPSVHGFD
jgi:hypothetical protein